MWPDVHMETCIAVCPPYAAFRSLRTVDMWPYVHMEACVAACPPCAALRSLRTVDMRPDVSCCVHMEPDAVAPMRGNGGRGMPPLYRLHVAARCDTSHPRLFAHPLAQAPVGLRRAYLEEAPVGLRRA